MNREIKFRAWHKPTKTMMVGVGVLPMLGVLELAGEKKVGDMGAFEKQYTYYIPNAVEVMQFTGLHDKNGKEIWEGDICLVPNYNCDPSNGDNPNEIGDVAFFNAKFNLRLPKQMYEPLSYYTDDEHLEVIGNIYENPELLK